MVNTVSFCQHRNYWMRESVGRIRAGREEWGRWEEGDGEGGVGVGGGGVDEEGSKVSVASFNNFM